DYDGIRELDNVLPPWWLWLFYGTIAWGVIYLVNVHVIDIWPQQGMEYNNEMAKAKADVEAYMATLTNTVDENTVTLADDAATLGSGRALFKQFCTPCHGADAAGSETSVGPNLIDAYWLHGGGVKNVFRTIKYGVPEKGMISWKSQLQPAEIRALASYILSLQGSGPPTQKAPQGGLWKEEAISPDSTAVPVDTARTAAGDTVRMAMQ
ncbi:MAG TPA: cbb3-type cytochrome c oxidase N-terminal domain-containing protein, partial [Flavobacteriales bacterium]